MLLVVCVLKYVVATSLFSITDRPLAQISTGKPPFSELNERQISRALMQGKRPSKPTGTPNLDGFWNVVEGCWNPDPESRPSSHQLLDKLPLRKSPLTRCDSVTIPCLEWTLAPSSTSSSAAEDLSLGPIDSCLLKILDIDSESGQPWTIVKERLSHYGCPLVITEFVQNVIDGRNSESLPRDEPAPLPANPRVDHNNPAVAVVVDCSPPVLIQSRSDVEKLFSRARSLSKRGKEAEAIELCRKLVDLARGSPETFGTTVISNLGHFATELSNAGKASQAGECCHGLVELARNNPDKLGDLAIRTLTSYTMRLSLDGKENEIIQSRREVIELARNCPDRLR